MTKAAQDAAEKVRKAKEKHLEAQRLAKEKNEELRQIIADAEKKVRAETRKALNKRRYHVGALADEAGLFGWENDALLGIFQALTRAVWLLTIPDPAAVLDALLADCAPVDTCGAAVASIPPFGSLPHSLQGRNGEGSPSEIAV